MPLFDPLLVPLDLFPFGNTGTSWYPRVRYRGVLHRLGTSVVREFSEGLFHRKLEEVCGDQLHRPLGFFQVLDKFVEAGFEMVRKEDMKRVLKVHQDGYQRSILERTDGASS